MIRRRTVRETGRLPALRGAAGEHGMILVLTLVVLLVLSMLASGSLINGLLVRSQARTEANAAIALHAAEAGVAVGMAWLSNPVNIDDDPANNDPPGSDDVPDPSVLPNAYTTNAGWQSWSQALADSFANGGGYATTLRFKRERRDRNGDGDCCDKYPDAPIDEDSEYKDGDANPCSVCPGEVVLYNAGSGDGGFGFAGSYYAGSSGDQGFPVVEIESIGTHGATAVREVALFAARNHKAQVEGAFTTRTPFNTTSLNREIDGSNSGSSLCGGDLPGVTFDVGMALPCDLNSDGACDNSECNSEMPKVVGCAETFDPTQPGKRELSKTPWDALGMTEVDFRSLFTPDHANTLDTNSCNSGDPTNLWFTSDLTNAVPKKSCKGILVVHNPRFNPDKWDPASPGYDAAYASDDANAPAAFAIVGGGNFMWEGVVIADQVGTVNANIQVNGAVISLASGGTGVETNLKGSASITYNCDLVAEVTKRIGYKKKIGWQRVR